MCSCFFFNMEPNNKLRTIILQPTSLCNLNCKYCYLTEEARRTPDKMSLSLLDEILEKVFAFSDLFNPLKLVWHAGEPMLAGLDFYQQATQLIEKHRPKNIVVEQQIQTNGVLINPSWCDFFKEHNITVGVSLDGPEHIHNANRVNWKGRGSFDLTMRGVRTLQEYKVPFHALFVVSNLSLDYPDEIFNFFLECGINNIGFNIEELTGANTVSFLGEKRRVEQRYRAFLSRLMDLWMQHYPKMSIREFERLHYYLYRRVQDKQFVATSIETSEKGIVTFNLDGGIVPFSPDLAGGTPGNPHQFVVTNIQEINSLQELYTQEKFIEFYQSIQGGVNKCRNECKYFALCGGGHPTNKYFENQSFHSSETNFCQLYFQQMIDCLLNKIGKAPVHASSNR